MDEGTTGKGATSDVAAKAVEAVINGLTERAAAMQDVPEFHTNLFTKASSLQPSTLWF